MKPTAKGNRNHQAVASIVTVTSQYAVLTSKKAVLALKKQSKYQGRLKGVRTVRRRRRYMDEVFKQYGPLQVRRAYRMTEESFWSLLDIISPYMSGDGKRKRGLTVNGPITKDMRLATSLRYFCGGDPLDIAGVHGVNSKEVLRSVWKVVDAIHLASQLNITFPRSHAEQLHIAEGFKRKSGINLNNCVGAVDGMLVWMSKPTKPDLENSVKLGDAKFYCGRKKKFGLNMQAICDSDGTFLDVEIAFPGATSDFYAFQNSEIKELLETDDFLCDGLCLFGDNAYVNTQYMITPFKGSVSGAKAAFNYYHSSLRINIECAFGMLVHRWSILRKPMPINITVEKTAHMAWALCKLHNYCISRRDNRIFQPLPTDLCNISNEGGLRLSSLDNDNSLNWNYRHYRDRINPLLDGGEHQMDDPHKRKRHIVDDKAAMLMLKNIEDAGYARPPVFDKNRAI
jgi:hypothetical protein